MTPYSVPIVIRSRAFTLVETLIAVSILTLSIAGPLLAASRSLVLAQVSRDKLTASYLAQEGIEYVRAMRDDAYLSSYQSGGADVSGAAWSDFVSGNSSWSITPCVTAACTLDPTQDQGYGSGYALDAVSEDAPLYLTTTSVQNGVAGLVLKMATGLIPVDMAYDINKDGEITSADAFAYLRNGIYTQQQTGTRTPFTRTIQAFATSPTEETITSTVSWSFHDVPYTISITDHLTLWQ